MLRKLNKNQLERVLYALSTICLPVAINKEYVDQLIANGVFTKGEDMPYDQKEFVEMAQNEENFWGKNYGHNMRDYKDRNVQHLK